jgi:dihydrolipoamide dehydrogenase
MAVVAICAKYSPRTLFPRVESNVWPTAIHSHPRTKRSIFNVAQNTAPAPASPAEIFDVAIIGGGPAGYTAAIRAGQWGLKTALIEATPKLGGTCLHWGCIPTKSILHNAELWDELKHATDMGIDNLGTPTLNWPVVLKRKNDVVAKHVKGLDFLMRKNKVNVITGFGILTGPAKDGLHRIQVTDADKKTSTVVAKNIFLATGSDARMLPGITPDDRILSNIEMLNIAGIPKSLIVIGSGAVGVEFASIFKSFGSDVSILEFLPRIVPAEDEEISKELARSYKKRGIAVETGAKVEKVEKTKDGVKVTYTDSTGKQVVKEAEKCLVAVGRAPRTAGIGLEKTKIVTEKGFIQTNEWMQTAEPGIYAIGDIVAGLPLLAHSGAMCGMVAAAHIAGKFARPVRRDRMPACTYCEPQIGSVGLTEAQAKEKGYTVKIGKFPFSANSKASILGQHEGFVKVVSDAKYGEILGVHIIGPQATELIAEAVTALTLEATIEEMMFTIHAHPTLAEALLDGFSMTEGMAINI